MELNEEVAHLVKRPELRSLKECNGGNKSSIPGHGIGVRKKILATPCVGKHMYAEISVQSGLAANKPQTVLVLACFHPWQQSQGYCL